MADETPASTPAKIGFFTAGVARHADTTALEQNADKAITGVTELYRVVVNDETASVAPLTISGLPAKNAIHPSHANLYVSGYSWRHLAVGSKVWECAVKYERRTILTGASGEDDTRVTLEEWGFAGGESDVVSDVDTGNPVRNSAGDPFDTLPTRDEVYPCVRYGYKEKTFRPGRLWLNNCVNAEALTVLGVTFAPHACRLKVECHRNLDAEDFPYEWTYTFEGRDCWIRKDLAFDINGVQVTTAYAESQDHTLFNIGWDLAMVQCGLRYLDGNMQPVRFTDVDADGNVVESSLPQMLAEDGHALGRTSTPVFLVVRAYAAADLSGIAPKTT